MKLLEMFPVPLVGAVVTPVGEPINLTTTLEVPFGVLANGEEQPLAERRRTPEPTNNSMVQSIPRPGSLLRVCQPASNIMPPKGSSHPATVVGGPVAVVTVSVIVCGPGVMVAVPLATLVK